MGHSVDEVWKTSFDHQCRARESSQGYSGGISGLNKSDQLHRYGFKLCESIQTVQADLQFAINLDTAFGSR